MFTLKHLVNKEIFEMKERRKNETSGTYYIFYIFTILYTITTPIYTTPGDTPFDIFYLYFTLMEYVFLSLLYKYLYEVKENGTVQNIFLKYKFIPVDMDTLFLAKIIVLSRFIIINIFPAQILAFICRAYYTYKYGYKFFDLLLFLPVISGTIYLIIFYIIIYIYRQAAR